MNDQVRIADETIKITLELDGHLIELSKLMLSVPSSGELRYHATSKTVKQEFKWMPREEQEALFARDVQAFGRVKAWQMMEERLRQAVGKVTEPDHRDSEHGLPEPKYVVGQYERWQASDGSIHMSRAEYERWQKENPGSLISGVTTDWMPEPAGWNNQTMAPDPLATHGAEVARIGNELSPWVGPTSLPPAKVLKQWEQASEAIVTQPNPFHDKQRTW